MGWNIHSSCVARGYFSKSVERIVRAISNKVDRRYITLSEMFLYGMCKEMFFLAKEPVVSEVPFFVVVVVKLQLTLHLCNDLHVG